MRSLAHFLPERPKGRLLVIGAGQARCRIRGGRRTDRNRHADAKWRLRGFHAAGRGRPDADQLPRHPDPAAGQCAINSPESVRLAVMLQIRLLGALGDVEDPLHGRCIKVSQDPQGSGGPVRRMRTVPKFTHIHAPAHNRF
jgi:hypothetical protein